MKIKFEVKSNPKQTDPLYTIFMEHKGEDSVEFLITKHNITQVEMFNKNPAMTKQDVPINDGLLLMNRAYLKKFVAALQLLVKS